MKVIFLDIDGVLITDSGVDYWMHTKNDIFDSNGKEQFDPKAIEGLNRIQRASGAFYVITSHWKNSYTIEELQELFTKRGIEGDIISYTKNKFDNRTNNILNWIELNDGIESYVVIDEDINHEIEPNLPQDRFIKTTFTTGISDKNSYKRAINYLNKKTKKIKDNINNQESLF